ncbi:MAG: phosphotransferase [Actinomycetota bacterium]
MGRRRRGARRGDDRRQEPALPGGHDDRPVLRRSYRSKTAGGLDFEHQLLAHPAARGFPAPEVVPTRGGRTWLEADGRLHTLTAFVRGTPPTSDDGAQVVEMARWLARYHRLARTFRPTVAVPPPQSMMASLRERLESLVAAGAGEQATLLAVDAGFVLERGWEAHEVLERRAPERPHLVIHAGCRRGSVGIEGGDVKVILDFDSSHEDARVVDLVVAVHDYAKVYGDPESDAYKVPLDLTVAGTFLQAYEEEIDEPLTSAEIEALPAFLTAKRLKRGLGRFERAARGEPLSIGDVRKIALELARVRWLHTYRDALQDLLGAGV